MQALHWFTGEAWCLRHARTHLRHLFRHLPGQSGCNKRLRHATGLVKAVIRLLAVDTTLWTDDVWLVNSTPVECGRSRWTAKRSDLAGRAQYGYCAWHSRFFWGPRPHLLCTPGGLPITFALTGTEADERTTLLGLSAVDLDLVAQRPGQTLIADRNYCGREFEHTLAEAGIVLLPPARKGEAPQPGARLFELLRQIIKSINQTFKAHLDLERHGGRTTPGVIIRVLHRVLALTAAIWHNNHTDQPVKRSLTAYDHQPPLGLDGR